MTCETEDSKSKEMMNFKLAESIDDIIETAQDTIWIRQGRNKLYDMPMTLKESKSQVEWTITVKQTCCFSSSETRHAASRIQEIKRLLEIESNVIHRVPLNNEASTEDILNNSDDEVKETIPVKRTSRHILKLESPTLLQIGEISIYKKCLNIVIDENDN